MNTRVREFSVEPNTWRSGFVVSRDLLLRYGSQDHVQAFTTFGFTEETPPYLDRLNAVLDAVGWQTKPIAAPPPSVELFQALAAKRLPIRLAPEQAANRFSLAGHSWQRDLLGHMPWLLVPGHRQFVETLAATVKGHHYSQAAVGVASSLYWRTAVTGLLRDDNRVCLYGAAHIADPAEGLHALGPFAKRVPLHVKHAAGTPYAGESCVEYAVVSDWDELLKAIPMVEYMTFVLSDLHVCPS